MVIAAKAHNSNNCLSLNNCNRIGSGNVVANLNSANKSDRTSACVDDDDDENSNNSSSNQRAKREQCKQQIKHFVRHDNTATWKTNDLRYHHRVGTTTGNSERKAIQPSVGRCKLSSSILFCAVISLLLLHIDVINATKPQQSPLQQQKGKQQQQQLQKTQPPQQQQQPQQCESKVLEETPPDPVSIHHSERKIHSIYSSFSRKEKSFDSIYYSALYDYCEIRRRKSIRCGNSFTTMNIRTPRRVKNTCFFFA